MEEDGSNKENFEPSHEGEQLDVDERVAEMVSRQCALRQHSCNCSAPSIADLIVLRDRRRGEQQTLAPRQGFTRLTGTPSLASQQVGEV
jgi:hypothetical protein